jgi:hypothetical protein
MIPPVDEDEDTLLLGMGAYLSRKASQSFIVSLK